MFDNAISAFEAEREYLKSRLGDPLCLNIADGGRGGPLFKGRKHKDGTKRLLALKATGKAHSPEVRERISNVLTGRPVSAETRAKLSLKARMRNGTLDSAPNKYEFRAKAGSTLHRQRISEATKGKPKRWPARYEYQILSPDGETHRVEKLRDFEGYCVRGGRLKKGFVMLQRVPLNQPH